MGRPAPVLCWGDRCVGDDRRAVPTPPAPVTAASTPTALIGLEQVCSGARCDPLGPRLRAVLAKAEPDDHRSATRDTRTFSAVASNEFFVLNIAR